MRALGAGQEAIGPVGMDHEELHDEFSIMIGASWRGGRVRIEDGQGKRHAATLCLLTSNR